MSGEVARTIQEMLLAVVQEGTATKADLATFDVAGKSGTARRTSQDAGYTPGNYTASFVGLFPGNDPQYVVLVKLDNPRGAHYTGGEIAAPVTQIVLRAALAARDAALNREGLAAAERSVLVETGDNPRAKSRSGPTLRFARSGRGDATNPVDRESYDPSANLKPAAAPEATPTYVVELPTSSKFGVGATAPSAPRRVPDVRGLSVREAVRLLHSAGFRVRIVTASGSGTWPAAGAMAVPGTIVQLTRALE